MRILITGAAGMIGRKLTARLLDEGRLAGREIEQLDLVDIAEPVTDDSRVNASIGDLTLDGVADELAAREADVVFHLAGVVSGEAELDLDKGLAVNLDGTRRLFDALRRAPGTPRVVFTSSIAVFGAPFPNIINDDFHLTPLTSYGAQKAMAELLLADFTRRELFDGIGVRLPTISVRPGAPNAAASGFFSGIIREPLAGKEAVLPVSRDVVHTHSSPRSAVSFLLHAAGLDGSAVGPRRNLTMPGVSVSVAEQIDALERVAGPEPVALIREERDDLVASIVSGWPSRFNAERARQLGFVAEPDYDTIIRTHISDELS